MKKIILMSLICAFVFTFISCNVSQQSPQQTDEVPVAATQSADPTDEPTPIHTMAPKESAAPTETPPPTSTPIAPVSVQLEAVDAYPALSFEKPLYFVMASGNNKNCFVVEQTGKILVFEDSVETVQTSTFLDLSDKISIDGNEKGLLGLEFHPDFSNNGYFYVNYTDESGTVIARYTVNSEDTRMADQDSEQILLTFSQPYKNHNGGQLEFGPDGYLYIATGDGGSSGDPDNNAQNPASLLGKILRIDVDKPSDDKAYSIPSDNPYAGGANGYKEEIYAIGLRNPWRFSFDEKGVLWVADVGQNMIEEIDHVELGKNYGWSIFEGTQDYKDASGTNTDEMVPPIWEYAHDASECITGGYVYTSDRISDLVGRYIYGDFESGIIWALWIDENGQVQNEQLVDTELLISSFGIDAGGDIRIIDWLGKVYRLQVM